MNALFALLSLLNYGFKKLYLILCRYNRYQNNNIIINKKKLI